MTNEHNSPEIVRGEPPDQQLTPFRVGKCRSCPAPIIWAETEAKENKPGRKIPIDADPDNHGYAKIVEGGNLAFTGQTTGEDLPVVRYVPKAVGRHVTHFSTCPNAESYRKSR